jgi:hypothetical protein
MCNCCTHTISDHGAVNNPVDYINYLVNAIDQATLQDLAVALAQHTESHSVVTALHSLWLLPSQTGIDYNPENTL